MRKHQVPLRVAAGAFILNSGLAKVHADEKTVAELHGMAAGTYPFLSRLDPVKFVSLMSKAEIALGSALLLPLVPSFLAGLGLTGFAGGLVGLYLRTPGLRQEGSLRPTPQGLGISKDVWLLAIGLSLVCDEIEQL
jgi:hypothetical protein